MAKRKVVDYTNRSTKLLDQRNTDAALTALGLVSEALSVSSYSETLLEMKAEALCLLQRYEEAIRLCEQSMAFADSSSKKLESSVPLSVTLRELLRHKAVKHLGQEAIQKQWSIILLLYLAMLDLAPFSAICLCNRGAAHQALGQITDAIADCSLAIAPDGNYVKAVSRRATLHEIIRDYGEAASYLHRLVSILENQSNDMAKESGSLGRSSGSEKELRDAHRHTHLMEEAKKGISLHFYIILGITPSDESSDIKKAYRKAALKHHPDKVITFIPPVLV
ncbi:uncharacterized protein [Pyrus communis]|uniref:uncharacterized protein n=1 Tax=Pyrus communis TaxID=23211 RepID=UPI0035C1C396